VPTDMIATGKQGQPLMRQQKALMNCRITEHGTVLVHCPYCILYFKEQVNVDVTRFVERDGKKESVAYCLRRQHRLVFRSIDNWREDRQKKGLQAQA
jgi:hypothetical protein